MIRIVNVGKDQPQSMDGHQPLWLITFADLIGLLLVFFVLLFSMSSLEQGKLQRLTQALSGHGAADAANRQLPDPQVREGRDPGYLTSLIKAKFDDDPVLRHLPVSGFGDRAIVSLNLTDLAAAIGPQATAGKGNILYALAGALRMLPNQILVESRLAPLTGEGDRANWEKSLRVAMTVAQALRDGGLASVTSRARVAAGGEEPKVDIVVLSTTAPAANTSLTGGGAIDDTGSDNVPGGSQP